MDAKPVTALIGPTGTGKSALAEALADHLPLEIVSLDSVQVYRGLDIGTAKPDSSTRARIPHHLIDIRDPAEPFSAADFVQSAETCIDEIHGRGKMPLLTGGSLLYLKAFREGLADLPAAQPEIRQQIESLARSQGWQQVHRELAEVDPAAAARISPGDPQRLQRALEVYLATGKTLSAHHEQHIRRQRPLLQLALLPPDRTWLHKRLMTRLQSMFAAGLVEEVRTLYRRGDLSPELPAIKAVGYRQVWRHLAGELSLREAESQALFATRQFAKRQLTWLRSWPQLHLLPPPGKGEDLAGLLRHALKRIQSDSISLV